VTCSPPASGAPETVLGIDLGTSAVKVLLAGPDRTGTATYPVRTPLPGHAETDTGDWWRATRDAVRQAVAGGPPPHAIAVTGQMHGTVLTRANGEAVRPAIVWLDRRAGGDNPGLPGPVLRWLRAHEPDAVAAARWALQPKDWLRMRLTGAAATEPTDASGTGLYDVDRDRWLVDDGLLPPIQPSCSIAGRLTAAAAGELGLPPGIPVATGAADTAAALLAADLPGPGWALLVLGTGGQWVVPDPAGPFAGVGGRYRLAGARNVGAALDWVRGILGASWDELYATAARGPVSEPRFRPYLVPESIPMTSDGGWTGLALGQTRADLMSAALTGVAGLLRDHLDGLRAAGADVGQVLVAGGGSRDPAWRDLLATVLGLPLRPGPVTALSVHGAARIARYAQRCEDPSHHHDP
jgi:xylulokinase